MEEDTFSKSSSSKSKLTSTPLRNPINIQRLSANRGSVAGVVVVEIRDCGVREGGAAVAGCSREEVDCCGGYGDVLGEGELDVKEKGDESG